MGKRGMAGLEAWGRGMTGTKQWKKQALGKAWKNNLKKISQNFGPEANILRDFFEIIFPRLIN